MGGGATSILTVDPAAEVRTAVTETCAERDEVSVETAAQPPPATRLEDFDGIVTEYNLEDVTGVDLVERARDAGATMPVVLLTDAEPATFAERALASDVDGYVPKERSDAIDLAIDRVEAAREHSRGSSELARRYGRLLEQDVIGVYVIQDGTLEFCNDRTATMWGYDRPAAMTGRPVIEFIDPEYRDSVRENVDRVQAGDVIQRRLAGVDADGERIDIEVHSWQIDRGGAPAVMGVCQDVTERVQHRRQLEAQNDRLETMASVISHDLRNPLNVASGYVDLLQDDVEDERLDAAATALERIEAITDDLLAMSRQSQQSIETETLSLRRQARTAWQTVETAGAELVVAGEQSLIADPQRLAQCLENLFANAVDHGGEDVTVTVEPLEDGFAVADDGRGIDPEDRDRIFERGYTSEHRNTGLGLSIVATVAEDHDWEVTAGRSDAGGARFEFHGVEAPE